MNGSCGFLLGVLLGCIDEQCQHGNCEDDADGICNCGVVSHQLAVCIGVDHLAQALRSQHEVGAGHSAHKGVIVIDGETIQLPQNNFGHCLHGGPKGWQYQVYDPLFIKEIGKISPKSFLNNKSCLFG